MALFKFLKKKDASKAPKGFHSIAIKEVRRLTNLSVQIVLDIPNELKDKFTFTSGQYINFILTINGKEERRSYSICSGQNEDLSIGVKQIDKGVVSTWFNTQAKVGMMVLCSSPEGLFKLKPEQKNIVAFSGGSGITPILSIAKEIQATGGKMRLFYGNYSLDQTLFKSDIDALSSVNATYVFSDEPSGDYTKGVMDEMIVENLIKSDIEILKADAFFLCGPLGMIESTEKQLLIFGVSKEKIKKELFVAPTEDQAPVNENLNMAQSSDVTVILEGEEIQLKYKLNGKGILDTLNNEGYDPPYSCRGGVCSTCKTKVLEGSAEMKINYSLTDEDIAEGYVLCCQAIPTSSKLTLSFDE